MERPYDKSEYHENRHSGQRQLSKRKDKSRSSPEALQTWSGRGSGRRWSGLVEGLDMVKLRSDQKKEEEQEKDIGGGGGGGEKNNYCKLNKQGE